MDDANGEPVMTITDRLPSRWLAPGCRWVRGDPGSGPWHWCAEPLAAPDRPYCREHAEAVRR
jgi:hypothetical protein